MQVVYKELKFVKFNIFLKIEGMLRQTYKSNNYEVWIMLIIGNGEINYKDVLIFKKVGIYMYLTKYYLVDDLDENRKILFNTITRKYDIVSNDIYQKILELEHGREIDDEKLITKLINKGYLYKNRDEEQENIEEKNTFLNNDLDMNFTICPSMGCNLHCSYCFEKSIELTKDKLNDRQLDVILEYISLFIKKNKNVNISLMGGEPLLSGNKRIVTKVLEYCKEKNIKLGIITNGVNINEYIDIFNSIGDKNILYFQITIDGPRNVHDTRRVSIDKSGTYDMIMKNLEQLSQLGYKTIIRVNVDKMNIGCLDMLMDEVDCYKINKDNIFVNITPVLDFVNEIKNDIFMEDEFLNIMYEKYIKTKSSIDFEMIKSRTITYLSKYFDLSNKNVPYRFSYCEAIRGNSMIFIPNGKIITCLSLIDNDNCVIGKFDDKKITLDRDICCAIEKRTTLNMSKCRECRYSLICGGGCLAESIRAYNNIMKSVCPNVKEISEFYFNIIKDKILKNGK